MGCFSFWAATKAKRLGPCNNVCLTKWGNIPELYIILPKILFECPTLYFPAPKTFISARKHFWNINYSPTIYFTAPEKPSSARKHFLSAWKHFQCPYIYSAAPENISRCTDIYFTAPQTFFSLPRKLSTRCAQILTSFYFGTAGVP
jgi:hypothetical protein